MGTGQWQRIEELFNGAATLQGDARRSFLDQACGADRELRREVESLLQASERGEDVALDRVQSAFAAYRAPAPRASGQRIGAYVLLREIGHGGMGAVFLAERADDQFRKQVAVKFMRGVPNEDLLRRFRSERQILATLEHPNIARLLDGGVSDAGEPYVVMEYVEGSPIDAYCDRKALDTQERLRLFRDVCSAVQAAHRSLVVHRDIKPLNILVADGTVKLLDFGIAKLLDDPDMDATATSARLLTPDYASPEQVQGAPITTASDIYSLGVLLYKLLTGAKPYKVDARNPGALARAITQDDPDPPSRAPQNSRLLRRELEGDLDTIVLKAMRKEPAQRYATVDQLSDDIRRYLDGRPVLARPATRGYRLRKFVGRHGAEVAATIGALVLVAGLTALYMARLARERDFALQEQRTSQQVTEFVQRVFRISNPSETRGRTITALEVLDSAAARIPRELASEPQVKAAMLYTLGTVYKNLGRDSTAKRLIEDGLRLRDSIGGRGSPAAGEFFSLLGDLNINMGRFDSAAALFRSALGRLGGEYGALDYRMFEARMGLGNSLTRAGHYAAADSVLAANVAAARTLPSDTGGIIVDQLNALGALRLNQRRADEAVPIVKEAWERARDKWGEDSPAAIINLSNLGFAYRLQSRFREAEPIVHDVVRLFRRVNGDRHANTATAWNNLALVLNAVGKDAEAEQAARQALDIWRGVYGGEHQRVALGIGNVATMLMAQGKYAESESLHRDALAIRERILIPGHAEIATGYSQLGQVLQLQGRLADAERMYRRALEVAARGAGIDSPDGATYATNLGGVLMRTGRMDEAERVLRAALGTQRQKLPAVHVSTAATLTTLGSLLTRTGRARDAEPALAEALRIRTALLDSTHWTIHETRSAYGAALAALGRSAEAESLLTSSADALAARFGSTDPRARDAADRVTRSRQQ